MPYQFSDALDDQLLFERCETFGGGMDSFRRSTLLAPDQWQYGQNIIVPDNLEVRTRPGADTLGATLASAIQGLIYFDTITYEQLIAGAGTKLYQWGGAAWVEMAGWTLTDGLVPMEAAQGIDKVLLTDGTQNMRSWNGLAFTDLGNTANTVGSGPPVGATILCWHTGRMFASGKGSASDTVWASSLLDFSADHWNHLQFSLRVGGGEGDPVKAMASLQDFWLGVLKENSIYLVNTDPTAATAAQWAVRRVSLGIGCVGRKAWCMNGNDLLFFSRDGVRSLQRMQAAAGQYELSPPISEPMQPYIDRINWTYAGLIAACSYKHLSLFAVPLDNAVANNTVLVWNGRLQKWVGVWTGWTPVAWEVSRFNGVLRLVLGESTGLVRQWKDFADQADNATYLEDGAAIASKWWSKGFLFNEPVNDKDAYHAEARFSASNALVNFTVVADGSDLFTWTKDLRPAGQTLPVSLPFNLDSAAAVAARRGLRGLTPFNEAYLKIESTSGWWALRNVTLSAYLNMLQNQ